MNYSYQFLTLLMPAVYILGIGVINIVTLLTFLLMLEIVLKFEDVVMLVHVTKMYNDEIK
jgi:hypothetical protein